MQLIFKHLKDKYKGDTYDIFSRNCNHFTEELAFLLLNEKNMFPWVNRISKIGFLFAYWIPEK